MGTKLVIGNLIGKRHDINNPILSTNDEFLKPPEFEPLNKVQSLKGVNQFDFNRGSMVNSTLLNIPLIPNIIEPVFPPSLPIENSVAFNICFWKPCKPVMGSILFVVVSKKLTRHLSFWENNFF